ncbi:A24 family peptidase [Prochlorococcus sp. MIT 1307]|uniref:A24 family peptidase n=1 Tax=Prochlorococcus sp. MIT 1307 TaxID=3096219 RepID=UPI002A765971|nr:A24 family peptidase [Prochlorococcus sp. MIT 1307]
MVIFPALLINLPKNKFISLSILLTYTAYSFSPEKNEDVPQVIILAMGIILAFLLIRISLIDISRMCIPNSISNGGLKIGLFSTALTAVYLGFQEGFPLIINHILAAFISQKIMASLSKYTSKIFRQEVLGLGDSKLVAMGGAWLGLSGISLATGIAFVSAGIFSFFGIICGKLKRMEQFPFGPFIAAGIWGVWLFEPSLWEERWLSLWGL